MTSPPITLFTYYIILTSLVHIMTANARLSGGAIRVDSLEIGLIADPDCKGGISFWMFMHSC